MGRPMKWIAAVAIRLYSGWSYVSLRLGAEVVEYEESGVFALGASKPDGATCKSKHGPDFGGRASAP